MTFNWNFQKGKGFEKDFPSMGEIYGCYGTTQFNRIKFKSPVLSLYRHIVSVDPLPKRGARFSTPRMSASSSQDMITALMFQQEARREEERKLEAERRREQERK